MRKLPHQCRDEACRDELCHSDDSFGDPRGEEWWATLSLSEWISYKMSDVLCALGEIRAQLNTEQGRPLRWMRQSVDCAFADADRILERLDGKDGNRAANTHPKQVPK